MAGKILASATRWFVSFVRAIRQTETTIRSTGSWVVVGSAYTSMFGR
jgi:hypothetical protein